MNNKITPQNLMLVLLFLFTLILGAFILKPFISIILTALIIGYVFYPTYKFLREKTKTEIVASVLTLIIIVLIITLPTIFISNTLAREAYVMYTRAEQVIVTGTIGTGFCEGKTDIICRSVMKINELLGDTQIKYYMQQGLEKITSSLIDWATGLALSIPKMILQGVIVLFLLFYFFKDHKRITDKIKVIIPIKTRYKKDLLRQIDNVTYAIIFGYIIIAILEGIIGVIGFMLFMPNSPNLIWGITIAFLALIPIVGASIVWWPAIIIQLINGHWLLATGLIICLIITSYIDIVTRAKLIGQKADIHPIYVILGVIGGITLIGIPGIVVGPLTLAILNTFLKIFTGEKTKERT